MDVWSLSYDNDLVHFHCVASITRSLNRSNVWSLYRHIARSITGSANRFVIRSLDRSLTRSIARLFDSSIARSFDPSIAQSFDPRSIDRRALSLGLCARYSAKTKLDKVFYAKHFVHMISCRLLCDIVCKLFPAMYSLQST